MNYLNNKVEKINFAMFGVIAVAASIHLFIYLTTSSNDKVVADWLIPVVLFGVSFAVTMWAEVWIPFIISSWEAKKALSLVIDKKNTIQLFCKVIVIAVNLLLFLILLNAFRRG